MMLQQLMFNSSQNFKSYVCYIAEWLDKITGERLCKGGKVLKEGRLICSGILTDK